MTMPTEQDAKAFFETALTHVESARIRAWATSEHNRPLFEEEALQRLQKGRSDALQFATSILCLAIGL